MGGLGNEGKKLVNYEFNISNLDDLERWGVVVFRRKVWWEVGF